MIIKEAESSLIQKVKDLETENANLRSDSESVSYLLKALLKQVWFKIEKRAKRKLIPNRQLIYSFDANLSKMINTNKQASKLLNYLAKADTHNIKKSGGFFSLRTQKNILRILFFRLVYFFLRIGRVFYKRFLKRFF